MHFLSIFHPRFPRLVLMKLYLRGPGICSAQNLLLWIIASVSHSFLIHKRHEQKQMNPKVVYYGTDPCCFRSASYCVKHCIQLLELIEVFGCCVKWLLFPSSPLLPRIRNIQLRQYEMVSKLKSRP